MSVVTNFFNYIGTLAVQLFSMLPSSSFNFNTYVNQIMDVMGYVNWFIPFYLFKDIVNAWLITFDSALAIFIVFRFIRRAIHD